MADFFNTIATELGMVRGFRTGEPRWCAYLQTRTPRGYEQIDLASCATGPAACRVAAERLRRLAEQFDQLPSEDDT